MTTGTERSIVFPESGNGIFRFLFSFTEPVLNNRKGIPNLCRFAGNSGNSDLFLTA
jgi:hypothetical protein